MNAGPQKDYVERIVSSWHPPLGCSTKHANDPRPTAPGRVDQAGCVARSQASGAAYPGGKIAGATQATRRTSELGGRTSAAMAVGEAAGCRRFSQRRAQDDREIHQLVERRIGQQHSGHGGRRQAQAARQLDAGGGENQIVRQ